MPSFQRHAEHLLLDKQQSWWAQSPLNPWRSTAIQLYQPLQFARYPSSPTPLEAAMPPRSRYRDVRERSKGYAMYGGTYLNRRQRAFYGGRRSGRTRVIGNTGRYPGLGPPRGNMTRELKNHDTDIGLIGAVLATLRTINVCEIPQGITPVTRIGRKAMIKKFQCKYILKLLSTSTPANTCASVKLFLIVDTQTNGTTFTGADMLDADTFFAYNLLVNKGRFRIIKTKTVSLSSNGGIGTFYAEHCVHGEWNVDMKLMPIEYDNVGGFTAEQRSNSLWFAAIADPSGDAHVLLSGSSRVRFLD